MIRARLGPGWRSTPFSDFLDTIWADVWDDCPPLGDHAQYHEIVTKLIIEGIPAHEITYKDAKGKVHHLAKREEGAKMTVDQGREMMERARKLREKLQSQPSE